jgi:N-acetylneuraminic acid mutarotase
MRRIALLVLLLAAGPVLPGCAWFLFGGVAGVIVLTQEKEEDNGPPLVAIENPVRLKNSPGLVSYRLFDAEGDACSVVVEVSLAGGAFVPATMGAGGDGTSGLSAGAGGTVHVFAWDFASDLTSPEQSVRVRIVASDAGGSGPDAVSPDFCAGNVPPEVTALSLPSGPVTGTATLEITLSDTQSDVARVEVQFLRTSDGGDWTGHGAAATPEASPPELATDNLATLPSGKEHLYPWDSDAAGNLPGENAAALVRARATEDGVAWGSWFVAAGSVDIRNDHPPVCRIATLRLYQDGLVFAAYTVSDAESHEVSVLGEYQVFGETTWRRATQGCGTTPRTLTTTSSGAPGIFVWDSLKDRVQNKSVTLRLTPSQGGLLGDPDEREFLLGNDGSHGWFSAARLPSSRVGFACATAGGRVYAMGGRGQYSPYTDFATVEAYDPPSDTWSARAPLPVAGGGIEAAVLEGRIHVLGAGGTGHHVYDPGTDTWSTAASLPETRTSAGVAAANGCVYVAGGSTGSWPFRDTLYIYDSVTSAWTSGAVLPAAQIGHASAALGGRIYVVGGYDGLDSVNTVFCYDPVSNTWSGRAAMGQPRDGLGLTVHAGKMVAAGGTWNTGTSSNDLSSCEEYDPYLNTWRSLPSMPVAMSSCGAAAWNGKVYAVGISSAAVYDAWRETSFARASFANGREGIAAARAGNLICLFGGLANFTPTYFTTVEAFDPAANSYGARGAMGTARAHAGAAFLDGVIYLTGGETANQVETAAVGRYDPVLDSWSAGVVLPAKRSRHGCVSMGGRIWCAGGRYWDGAAYQRMANLTVFDPLAATWAEKAVLPEARSDAGCAALGGLVYMVAGRNASGSTTSTLYAYDPGADSWATKAPFPASVSGPAATVAGGRIAVLGGQPGSGNTLSTVYLYDPDTNAWVAAASLPSMHSAARAVSWNDRAYVFGGYLQGGPPPFLGWTNSAACYDPARQHLLANDRDLPAAAAGAAAFLLGGRLHVLGGRNAADAALANHRVLDVTGDVTDDQPFSLGTPWRTAAALPVAAHGAAALVAGGNAYVIGGLDASGAGLAAFLRYEPATDTWTALPDLAIPRGYLGFAAAAGRLYAFGGESSGIAVNIGEAFDPSTGSWVTPAPATLGTARSRFGHAAFEGRVYAFGGAGAGQAFLASCERFDPVHNAWTSLPALPKPVAGALCLEEGGVLRLFGGEVEEVAGVFRVTDRILVFEPPSGAWTRDEEDVLPCRARDLFGTCGAASWTHRGQAGADRFCFVGGGIEGTDAKTGVWRFYTRR